MTAPALDRLRAEIIDAIWQSPANDTIDDRVMLVLTRHITADVLAGLLDGTMVAVPVGDLMFGAGDFARLETYGSTDVGIKGLSNRLARLRDRSMLAAAKQEDRA